METLEVQTNDIALFHSASLARCRLKKKDSIITSDKKNRPEFKDFDANEDLETPEVIALLQEEVQKTHKRLRRNSLTMQTSFRKKLEK